MRRHNHASFLSQLAAAGLAVLVALGLSALAARSEGRFGSIHITGLDTAGAYSTNGYSDRNAGAAAPAVPAQPNDTLRVCGGSGRSFGEDTGPLVETIDVTGIPNGSHVTGVSVDLNILHSWSGDVVASLGHGAASVTLVDRPGATNTAFNCDCGCPYDNIVGTFADGAAGSADRCVLGSGGVDAAHGPYAPIGPGALADFAGSDPNGAWTLTLVDRADDESGSLPANGVCLNIVYSTPLAVDLASFAAAAQDGVVEVTWETVSELNNAGFNVYRGTSPAGWDTQLNAALIPSQAPGSSGGFVYTWEDRDGLVPGTTYYYWLQDVDMNGVATMHGPVSVDFTVPTAVTLSGVDASPAAGVAALPWLAIVAGAGAALALSRRR